MIYDWKKIFKNKSNKELYNIVKGKTTLYGDAIHFAKEELEKRNFDFENMESNRDAWKLSRLIEEDDYETLGSSRRKLFYISFKLFLVIISVIILIFYFFIWHQEIDQAKLLKELPLIVLIISTIVLINNFFYSRKQKIRKQRRKEIQEIATKLKKQNLLKENSPILKDITQERKREFERIRVFSYIGIGITVIIILIMLLKTIL